MISFPSPAESGRFLAGLRLVVSQNVGSVHPLGVVIEEGALLVEAVWASPVVLHLSVLYGLHLPEITNYFHLILTKKKFRFRNWK